MITIRQLYELTPLLASLWVLYYLVAYKYTMSLKTVIQHGLVYTSLILLFIAQTSWIMSIMSQSMFGTFLADIIWTLFDLVVVLALLSYIRPDWMSENDRN